MHILSHAPTDSPRGTVLLTHGFGEHHRRYMPLIDALRGADYDVAYFDFPGHGTAPGPRARVDVGALIRLHLELRQAVLAQARTANLFLFGHSMGGLITAASAILQPQDLRATVLSGPAMIPLPETPPELARQMLNVARMMPGLPATSTQHSPENSVLARNPQVQIDFDNDPLCHHGPVPLLSGITMVVQGDEALRRAARFTTPLLVFHGTEDELTKPEGSQRLVNAARAAGNADAHLRLVDGARHEVLNEVEGPAIIRDIILWFNAH